jgi:hypothetical protein
MRFGPRRHERKSKDYRIYPCRNIRGKLNNSQRIFQTVRVIIETIFATCLISRKSLAQYKFRLVHFHLLLEVKQFWFSWLGSTSIFECDVHVFVSSYLKSFTKTPIINCFVFLIQHIFLIRTQLFVFYRFILKSKIWHLYRQH